ncbi:putative membrane protein [Corynebacterium glutamicum MB001]|uniref:Hypothetical membrane protein n=1 Tax=Corynebacterium glutamicum (strain ATCC 13032 / DSM 20300 / JCM 1318 / BCRC 11384 / CCUG 27702 / LMG 3730 / NBRC 12168 / NCIMB 10025 / NRRL B-2784 / 534) TaxID=196627 RepID=Q8NTC9_CORGL|nr:DUF2516 family protein [Corynebacterium glutamicum]AGT04384.1 putative membrane protein [Corynebacterium glutamicum MB001]ARV65388.1 hypothetical protein B7P23_11010 [Corynebacterium glutamicum]ASW13163.1 putative membrane protein [Corynebacterium glutamicum]AUH99987.1 DUF2516 domain-containing protein [Corynebacterium glutamicum]AUI03626.1 DUF2516 domain-containing protein [Corynebacterium glutamicum]
MDISMLNVITSYTIWAIFAIIGICGFVGAFLAATTREDAFEVADRQKKMVWVAILIASGFVLTALGPSIPILPWVAIIMIGLYWFDVRPQIKSILEGAGGW